jgi:uncharacterized protein YbaP (TraB family)
MWKRIGLALVAASLAGAAQAQPPVWVVRDADSEMVLFGAMHVLPPGVNGVPPRLARALARADDLWFEVPIDPAADAEVGRLAQQMALLPPGQTLSDLISRDSAARLARICEAYDVEPAQLQAVKPWYAELMLSWAVFRRAGARVGQGVEAQVAARTPPTVRRKAFATAAEHVALLDGMPMADQVALLDEALVKIEAGREDYAQAVKRWTAGDLKALEREDVAPLRQTSPEAYRRLVTARSAAWTQVLAERLAGSGRTVVVVGVGHMVGDEGLPQRLRALGYSVQGP